MLSGAGRPRLRGARHPELQERHADARDVQTLADQENYDKVRILVTVIGGQGYIFGRGNQQISASIIKKVGRENIIVAASKNKMLSLFGKSLYVDTGDEEVNQALAGYIRVIVSYGESVMAKVSA